MVVAVVAVVVVVVAPVDPVVVAVLVAAVVVVVVVPPVDPIVVAVLVAMVVVVVVIDGSKEQSLKGFQGMDPQHNATVPKILSHVSLWPPQGCPPSQSRTHLRKMGE